MGGASGQGKRRVRQLAAARLVSTAGTEAAQIALVYQIYKVTHSGVLVAAALFSSICVSGLVGPLSGWVSDRYDRQRVMVASELAAGVAYLAMALMHRPGLLIVGVLVATLAGAPFRAASAAAVPNLVALEDLPRANGLLSAASSVALVLGPLVGGGLVAVSGAQLVFVVNAATFVVSAVLIATATGAYGGHADHGHRADLLAGFRLLLRDRLLAPLAASSALAYASFGAALVIDPALAHAFHAGSVGYGMLTSVWGGGAVVGAIIAGRIVQPEWAPRAVTAGMVAMALSLGTIPVLPAFAPIVAAGTLGGVGYGFVFVPWLLIVQHHTADAVRGRVIAATEAFDQTAFLAGMGLSIPVVGWVGAHHAYGVAAVLLALAAGAAARAMAATPRPETVATVS